MPKNSVRPRTMPNGLLSEGVSRGVGTGALSGGPSMAQGYRREPNWYLADGTYNKLSRSAMLTLAHLARLMDGKGWSGCVSTTRLVELTGIGRSSVARAINELREAGILNRENGEHRYEIRCDARPTGGTDCTTDGTRSAPPVGHERPTDGTRAPHGWESLPYSSRTTTKNTYQKPVCAESSVPFAGTTKNAYMLAGELLPSVKWNPHRRSGETGTRLLSKAILRIRDGARGPDAAQDPGGWIGDRMAEYLESLSDKKYHPDFDKWITKQYPDLVSEGEPLDAHR